MAHDLGIKQITQDLEYSWACGKCLENIAVIVTHLPRWTHRINGCFGWFSQVSHSGFGFRMGHEAVTRADGEQRTR